MQSLIHSLNTLLLIITSVSSKPGALRTQRDIETNRQLQSRAEGGLRAAPTAEGLLAQAGLSLQGALETSRDSMDWEVRGRASWVEEFAPAKPQ